MLSFGLLLFSLVEIMVRRVPRAVAGGKEAAALEGRRRLSPGTPYPGWRGRGGRGCEGTAQGKRGQGRGVSRGLPATPRTVSPQGTPPSGGGRAKRAGPVGRRGGLGPGRPPRRGGGSGRTEGPSPGWRAPHLALELGGRSWRRRGPAQRRAQSAAPAPRGGPGRRGGRAGRGRRDPPALRPRTRGPAAARGAGALCLALRPLRAPRPARPRRLRRLRGPGARGPEREPPLLPG